MNERRLHLEELQVTVLYTIEEDEDERGLYAYVSWRAEDGRPRSAFSEDEVRDVEALCWYDWSRFLSAERDERNEEACP